MKQVFIDIDGVLADFDGGIQKFYNATVSNPTEWDYLYEEDFNMSGNQFWNGLTEDFWTGLEPTLEADIILALVEDMNPCILSAPPLAGPNMAGLSGKVKWIRKNLPWYFKEKRFLLGSGKHFVAHEGAILIDDKTENIEKWKMAGGEGILWPQPWNKNRDLVEERLEYLQTMLFILQEDY